MGFPITLSLSLTLTVSRILQIEVRSVQSHTHTQYERYQRMHCQYDHTCTTSTSMHTQSVRPVVHSKRKHIHCDHACTYNRSKTHSQYDQACTVSTTIAQSPHGSHYAHQSHRFMHSQYDQLHCYHYVCGAHQVCTRCDLRAPLPCGDATSHDSTFTK